MFWDAGMQGSLFSGKLIPKPKEDLPSKVMLVNRKVSTISSEPSRVRFTVLWKIGDKIPKPKEKFLSKVS